MIATIYNKCIIASYYTRLFLLVFMFSFMETFAQTDICSTDPSGEVVVNGTSCTYVTFNKSFGENNGTAYWQNTNLNNCGSSTVEDTWGWFTAISTQTTINYQSTQTGIDVVLHLFDHCDPNMNSIACSDNTQGAGLEQITYTTVPGQIYHFRIQLYGNGGAFPGEVCVYSNVPLPLTLNTNDATAISSSGATLNGEANPNGTNATFVFEYGNTTAYGQTISGSPASDNGNTTIPILANLTGLQPNTTYHYRLKATNSSGDTFGADKTFTTPIQYFTSIEEASTVTTAGLYPFNINGTIFTTYVDANGWVLVANDVGAPISQNLQEVTTLEATIRGVLKPTILSNLGNFNTLNLRSSDGVLDVFSNNSTLISRIKQSQTLHQGVNDNAINDSWVGASSSSIKRDASCTTSSGTTLKENIIHTCGNFIGTNWIPSIGFRRISEGSGNVANTISFGLWVKLIPPPVINTLSNLTGCIGSILTINGNNLSTVQSVTIGGTPVTVVSTTDTAVTVRIAAGASGIVQVTTLGGVTTATDNFTITFDANEPLGTGCNPFTAISQASAITSDGLYTFNINGTQFETKAEGGYLLIANDVGEPVSQNLAEVQTLDITVRGILIPSILSELRFLNSIKIKSSDGLLDVTSNDPTLKSRVRLGQTLHQGVNDNAINDTWTGASAANVKDDAFCTTSNGTTLKENIIHTCGSSIGTTWIPSQGVRRISDGSGNVANTVSFGLWAQISIPPTITSLSSLTGCIGSNLTINGTNLSTTQSVTIGGIPVTVVSATETSVNVKIGIGASGAVQLTTPDGVATATDNFTIVFDTNQPLGTGCNPFTSLDQITTSTTDGSYIFNLNGNQFETKIEGGWVLIANDVGAPVSQDLNEVQTLDVTTRGILNTTILSNLGNLDGVKIKSSNGTLNVTSVDPNLKLRVKQGATLHQGVNDNGINDTWVGGSANALTGDATCVTTYSTALKANLIHTCGNANGTTWIPRTGERKITFSGGSVANDVSFGLWVKPRVPIVYNGITGSNLWLKANEGVTSSGSNLTGWIDQTGINTFTKQGTIGYKTNAINFNPAASFSHDASINTEPINRLDGNSPIDIAQAFAVYRNATSSNKRNTSLFGNSNSTGSKGIFLNNFRSSDFIYFENVGMYSAYQAFPNNIGYDQFAIQDLDFSSTVSPGFADAWTNGKNTFLNQAGGPQVDYSILPSVTPLIGGLKILDGYNFNGEVAEIITYPYTLTEIDRKKVESYFAVKYGITLDNSVGNYVNSSEVSIWDNATYWHDVFGIGKDATLGLNQPQSNSSNTGSGDGTGQNGKGNIVLSNPSSFDDGDFLMLGHNNGSLTQQILDLPASQLGAQRLVREWKVKRTADPGTVSLQFSTLGLNFPGGATVEDFALLVDIDGNGNFTDGTITEIPATSYTNNLVIFNSISLSDNSVFTLRVKKVAPGPGAFGHNLWLKANEGVTSSGISLTEWIDQTGINTFTKQGTIGYKTNAINFNPAASFSHDASINTEPINRLDGNSPIDIAQAFAVYRNATSSNKRNTSLFGNSNSTGSKGVFLNNFRSSDFIYFENVGMYSAYQAFPNNIGYDQFAIQDLDFSSTVSPGFADAWTNGKNTFLNQAGGPQVDYSILPSVTPLIGGLKILDGYNFNGEVAEIITYPYTLTEIDRKKVESYLAIKYGITLDASVTNYVSSSGTSIWSNTSYWHDVFGIGKDSKSALNQTQSNSSNTGSGNGTGQDGMGNIVISDPTSLDDGDFVMIGNDNGALTEQTTDLPINLSGKKRLGREWKVAKTNTPGNYNLTFDTKGLCLSIAGANDVKMVVDTDGDGVFSTATTIDAASYSNGVVYFSNLDLPNNAVFTFLTTPPTIQLTSDVGTDAQTVCANTAMTNIVYTTTKVTNAVVTGLPAGVSANFSSNTLTISGTPSAAGVFNYTIQTNSSQCTTVANVTGTITVTEQPTKPSITASSSTSFCAPGSVVLNSSTPTGNQWYKDAVAIVGATANNYTATDSGSYTVNTTQNDCISQESNQVVVTANSIPSRPTLIATGSTIVCEGASVRLHTSSSIGNKWYRNGNEILGETSIDYFATESGLYFVETTNATGCVSGLSVPIRITVNPNPVVAPITGADIVCANSTIVISSLTSGGVWSSSNTGIATIDGSGLLTGVSAGTVTITYSVTNSSGCVSIVTKNSSVKAQPIQPTVSASGATSFCSPDTVVLTSSANTDNQWYKDTILITGANTNVYTATDSGSYTVINTINGCSSPESNPVVVKVSIAPVVDPITGAAVVCAGSSIQLSNTILKGVWSSSNSGIASVDGSGLVTGVSAGSVTITFTVTTKFGCSTSVNKSVTIIAQPIKPTITASSSTSFCAPGSVVLNSSETTGIQWYKDEVAIASATSTSYTANATGTYTVMATQNGCNSSISNQVSVTANSTPTPPSLIATGNTIICEGASVRLHTSSPTGNKWFKNGVEILGETESDYIATTSGSYTVESINPSGCVSGLSVPILVTVNPNRIVAPITGADTVCANSSITLSSNSKTGVWSSSNTGIASIDGSGVVTGVSAGTVTITYSEANSSGCVTSVSKTITVTDQPIQPTISASGATSFCAPDSVVLTSSATTGNQWFKDGAAIVGATAKVFTATDSGSYMVQVTQNGCGSLESDAVGVKVSVAPVVDPIAGAAVVCAGSSIQLSNTILKGVWSSSNTGIASVDGSGLVIGISRGTATITFTVTTKFGCVTSVSKTITVTALPFKPSITTSGSTSFCTPGSVVLRSSATTGNQWYKDGVTIAGATSSSYTATVTGVYTVISTQYSCISVESDQISVTANASPSAPTLNATGKTIICEGASVRLHTSSLTGNKWFKNGVEIPGETGSDYIATTSGSYTVESINPSGCVSGLSVPILVTINPNRIVAPITGADTVCANSSITLSSNSKTGVWSSSNTGIASIDGSGVVTGVSAGTVTITYSEANSSGCVTSVSKTITVTAQPIQPTISASGATSFCAPDSVVLTSSSTTGNQWFKDGAAIVGATAKVFTATDSGSYMVQVTQNGCGSLESDAVGVKVSVAPVVDPIAGAAVVCAGSSIQLSNTILKGVWSSSNTGIASVDGSGLVIGISRGTATITFTVTTKFGCVNSVSKTITVTALPFKPSITTSGSTSFCAPGSVVLRSSATTGNQWYKDGLVIAGATSSSYTATVTGVYTVIVTQNSCISVESDQVSVTANSSPSAPTLNATGNTIICEGASVRLHTSSLTGNKWFNNGVEIPGETASDYIATTSGSYTVESINPSGCVSGTSTAILVTVNPNRIVAPITGADTVCANSNITLASATTAGVWSSSNTGIASIDGSGVVTGVSAGTVTISYSASNTSGCTTSVTQTVTVTAQPVQPTITTTGLSNFCTTGSVVLRSSAPKSNQWYKDGVLITGAIASVYNATTSGSYTVSTSKNNCMSGFSDPVVITATTPIVNPIIGDSAIDLGSTSQLSNTTPGGTWQSSAISIATISASGLVTGLALGNVVISYTVTNSQGCSTTVTKSIAILSLDLLAVNDDFRTTPIDSSKGAILDVLTNDKQNNGPINNTDVTVSIIDANGLLGVTTDNLGKIMIPIGSEIGSYVLTYSICYVGNSNNCSVATITIIIKDPCDFNDSSTDCDIDVKNAVSPNNDGLNDVLFIEKIENYPDNSVEIFNRWGQLVYKTIVYNNTSNAFNGISQGKGTSTKNGELPEGTYFYVIKYKKPISGIIKQKAGYLFISR
ncbi:Ig-like domain-containing protein [Flavobacterium praedii]|uniref:Ig-like domain-containing protein n=1 Tax=Flavobacterium praedii TaxID=3002900 RepID=UPI002481B2D1|nr:Ig-like domain-containing protein [Flavobacterium praedii]